MELKLESINLEEAARYGQCGDDEETRRDLEQTAKEVLDKVSVKWTWKCLAVEQAADGAYLPDGDLLLPGSDMKDLCKGCHHFALMAVTLGHEVEQLLRRYSISSPRWALLTDACASSAVECACDQAEQILKEQFPHWYFTDRFSPGYGDLPITLQGPLCALLDTHRQIGVGVSSSGILIPRKTVTAIIGLSDTPKPTPRRGCQHCPMFGKCAYTKNKTIPTEEKPL